MKAIILAAGLGSRLAPITDTVPKSLVEVNGKPILFNQIEILRKNGIEDITIISGYKSSVLESAVENNFSNIRIIENKLYASTNNMYSAFLGKEYLIGEDFLLMNADVFFDQSIITALLECKSSNAIATDVGHYVEESMKIVENNGVLEKISKQITAEEAYGTSIDVYKFSKEGGKIFFDQCEHYIVEDKNLNSWTEVAINDIFNQIDFVACPFNGRWLEIDNHEDLSNARTLFKGSGVN